MAAVAEREYISPSKLFSVPSNSVKKLKFYKNGNEILVEPPEVDERDVAIKCTLEDLTVSEPVTSEKIAEKLEMYGGCVVKNYLSKDTCDQILKDIAPRIKEDKDWDGHFFPPETKRVTGMCIKSKTCAESFMNHPLNVDVSNKFLGRENAFWIGDKIVTGYSSPQHNSCITFSIGPGAKNQVLHRDDMIHHQIKKSMDKYEYGSDSALGTVLCLSDKATKKNGTTRFIPGSHKWGHFARPRDEDCVHAEMEKGDCFFMLASCYHGGSANVTKDEYRILTILFMTLGVNRQEENIQVGTDLDYYRSLKFETLKTLGFIASNPFLGWSDLKQPYHMLDLDYIKNIQEPDDFYSNSFTVA
ncbi:phytanoyl-CoA dioxygenase family protein [Ascoidea rubescens DSM 1968]|uniref:Phytanoyl-dioxygenase family protein n=1 Tax=Ascoidea rubescens DSM 1968 TaxID=1344418 RepID=A0A1D2VEG3_9ASCO|nr:phytanoyl-dioxygenase family protein [Ascoidea rubescens DSM 1968]XP_020046303.1 phytanoyl-dioxygenase family protein [Ascoidea rubescens DSM 1968]XP_020046306.1 phytanoyl-dioxygenase family protein [Ascoidea rubescens DSM 1968]ODV57841.1 phytanoyl-dioxygenase family protein [Ascoidea rubescens DSM 1968]ODV59996.1 phytanoyl-dioxygenase family protein [Ascoidea rubescens DSM 1968]ODV59999.1 phytanoyl-dioxygenase family protein [Ascoidea rubescens DSM 1968]